MKKQIFIWGDSILKGVVLDEKQGKYIRLKEKSCVASVEQELHIPIEN